MRVGSGFCLILLSILLERPLLDSWACWTKPLPVGPAEAGGIHCISVLEALGPRSSCPWGGGPSSLRGSRLALRGSRKKLCDPWCSWRPHEPLSAFVVSRRAVWVISVFLKDTCQSCGVRDTPCSSMTTDSLMTSTTTLLPRGSHSAAPRVRTSACLSREDTVQTTKLRRLLLPTLFR